MEFLVENEGKIYGTITIDGPDDFVVAVSRMSLTVGSAASLRQAI